MRSLQVRCVSKITRVRNICQGPCFMSHPVYVKEEITKFCKMPCRLPSDSSSGLPPKSRRNSPSRWNEKWGTLWGSFTQRYALIFKCSRQWRCIHNTSELFCRVNLTACAVSGIKRSKSDKKNAMFTSTSPNAGDNIGWLTGVNVWWSTFCTFPNHTQTAKNITWSQLLIAF